MSSEQKAQSPAPKYVVGSSEMQNQRELEMLTSFCGTGVHTVQRNAVFCPMVKGQADSFQKAVARWKP